MGHAGCKSLPVVSKRSACYTHPEVFSRFFEVVRYFFVHSSSESCLDRSSSEVFKSASLRGHKQKRFLLGKLAWLNSGLSWRGILVVDVSAGCEANAFQYFVASFEFAFIVHREWPQPVLLKQPEDNKLGFPVWDPRVRRTLCFEDSLCFPTARCGSQVSCFIFTSGKHVGSVSPDADYHAGVPAAEFHVQRDVIYALRHDNRVSRR